MGSQKVIVILVEGLMDIMVYRNILTRLFEMIPLGYDELPLPLQNFLSPLDKEYIKTFKLARNIHEIFVVLINSRGFDNLKETLKRLIKRKYELIKLIRNYSLNILVLADKDKNPSRSIYDSLANFLPGIELTEYNVIKLNINDLSLHVTVIEQGFATTQLPYATQELEDHIASILKRSFPELFEKIKKLNEVGLDSKQLLLIYLALIYPRIKIRTLMRYIDRLMENVQLEEISQEFSKFIQVFEKISASEFGK